MDLSAATTDDIAAIISARILADPGPAISLAPAVDQLTGIMTDRLPYLPADDLGAVLLHLGCYLADAMRIMRGPGGLSADAASLRAADIVTLTGERLYTAGQQAARDRRSGGGR
jgi:hypothetical protein